MADVPLPIEKFRTASSADIDILHDKIYWTDRLEGKIYHASLAGGHPSAIISLDMIAPEAIVVDWIGRNMYWADSGTGLIEVADLKGKNRKILVKDGLTHVTSLALDLQTQ